MPTRTASATWKGGLKNGSGHFSGASGLGGDYTAGSRFGEGQGLNPEDLLAAAEASCFSMALSGALERNGTPPTQIDATAHCTVERVGEGFTITKMHLEVRAEVPNIDEDTFQKLAVATRDGCPVSRALKGNVDLQVSATLSR
jgi:lipoyl-dependent peroxiredoxin